MITWESTFGTGIFNVELDDVFQRLDVGIG